MKKVIITVVCVAALPGCRKQSGGQNGPLPPGSVLSVRYHDETFGSVQTTEFGFQGGQLTYIWQQTIDSNYGDSRNYLAINNVVYSFQYVDTSLRSVSYSVTDTAYFPGGLIAPSKEKYFQLSYDSLGRIISDSLLDKSGVDSSSYPAVFYWNYGAGGIGVYVPGYGRWDTINYVGNLIDWYSQGWGVYDFGTTANPLFDPALAAKIGPLMFYIGAGQINPPFTLPIDFFSKQLPVSGQTLQANMEFAWEKDGNGRVSGGVAVPIGNAEYGVTDITFTYR
jgi:hypothetical protein